MIESVEPQTRLLGVLRLVEEAGQLNPAWDPYARSGFTYRGTDSPLEDSRLYEQLELLASRDYLERVFVERLSICPNCDSHAVNVHEACVSCTSSNLMQFKVYFHFRCGYTGPVSSFKEERKGLRCPKCNKIMNDLGTDFDSPGNYFQCRACASMFQTPEVGARCTSCGARYAGTAMAQLRTQDVSAYRLTNLGRAALEQSRLLIDDEEMRRADFMLERRHAIVQIVDDARRQKHQNGSGHAVLALRPSGDDLAAMDAIAKAISEQGYTAFKLGRIDATHVLALVEGISEGKTRSLLKALNAHGIPAKLVDIGDSADVGDSIDVAARLLDTHA